MCIINFRSHRSTVHRKVTINPSFKSTSIEIGLVFVYDFVYVSAFYKPPGQTLVEHVLRKLTNSCDWFVAAGKVSSVE